MSKSAVNTLFLKQTITWKITTGVNTLLLWGTTWGMTRGTCRGKWFTLTSNLLWCFHDGGWLVCRRDLLTKALLFHFKQHSGNNRSSNLNTVDLLEMKKKTQSLECTGSLSGTVGKAPRSTSSEKQSKEKLIKVLETPQNIRRSQNNMSLSHKGHE